MQTRAANPSVSRRNTLQLLEEQARLLQKQKGALNRRLADERREGLADAAEMKRLNRQARLEEKENKRKLREEAIRMQRYMGM